MPKSSVQFSVTGLAPSAIVQAPGMQALGTVGTPLGIGQDTRNIGKGLEPGVGRRGRAAYRRATKLSRRSPSRIILPNEPWSSCRGRCGGHRFKRSRRAGDTASRADATDASAANPGTEL
jgi:hypothetical protein